MQDPKKTIENGRKSQSKLNSTPKNSQEEQEGNLDEEPLFKEIINEKFPKLTSICTQIQVA